MYTTKKARVTGVDAGKDSMTYVGGMASLKRL
jgi:hypothetical protein